jgi:hypothetical protein
MGGPSEYALARRHYARRRSVLRTVGVVLIAYGVLGVLLFAGVAYAVERPIDEAGRLTVSIEGQRGALLASLEQASATIEEAAIGVRGMDASLEQAGQATDRAAQLSVGVAASMYELRNAMGLTVFGVQPLIGLAAGFDETGQQLELLAQDVAAIGIALEANRGDAVAVADSLAQLSRAVDDLTQAVADGPALEVSSEALDGMRLAIYGVIAWMLALAVGCIAGGVACWRAANSDPLPPPRHDPQV